MQKKESYKKRKRGDEGNILAINKDKCKLQKSKTAKRKGKRVESRLSNLLCERKKEKVSERTRMKNRKTEGMEKKKDCRILTFRRKTRKAEHNKRLVKEEPT